jgi:hypothetical protein
MLLQNYTIIKSLGEDWMILNEYDGVFEIITDTGLVIPLDKELKIQGGSFGKYQTYFEIIYTRTNEKFLVLDNFARLLESNSPHTCEPRDFAVPIKDFHVIENKITGNFLIVNEQWGNNEKPRTVIYWDIETNFYLRESEELPEDPLELLRYVFVKQSRIFNS